MRLLSLRIQNFKSLADVTFEPSDLTLIVGPNNAGKTNLAKAFFFLSEVYEYGLETAVRRSGGYENIARRKKRRSKAAISFEIKIRIHKEFKKELKDSLDSIPDLDKITVISHEFSLQANKQSIKSEFQIENENLKLSDEDGRVYFEVGRTDGYLSKEHVNSILEKQNFSPGFQKLFDLEKPNPQKLFLHGGLLMLFISPISRIVTSWAVYEFDPTGTRKAGVPTPNPQVESDGANLPALVDYLINKDPDSWQKVESAMRAIIPSLSEVSVGFDHHRTLGLFFIEENFGRPWTAQEVSDGTILTLAMLCSAIDPRTTLVFMEEPENSVHPWIIREVMSFLKEVSKEKNVILTTHSHTVIDLMHPKDIWAISREGGESKLVRLSETDDELISGWENGDFKTSDYLDSGLIPNVVP